jgi:hypothetical protein
VHNAYLRDWDLVVVLILLFGWLSLSLCCLLSLSCRDALQALELADHGVACIEAVYPMLERRDPVDFLHRTTSLNQPRPCLPCVCMHACINECIESTYLIATYGLPGFVVIHAIRACKVAGADMKHAEHVQVLLQS